MCHEHFDYMFGLEMKAKKIDLCSHKAYSCVCVIGGGIQINKIHMELQCNVMTRA